MELSQSDKIVGEKLMPSEIIDICIRGGIPSIAYTYNEPAIFFEYAYDISKLAHFKGIKNVYVTSGYETPEALEMISPYLDAMNIDLKSFNEEFYKKLCNASLSPVLETIKKAYKLGIWIEITTLIIPGENNSDAELEKIARFIASVDKSIPWHVSAFRPCYKLTEKSPTPHSDLIKAYNIGKKAGLNHVYVGNIISKKYSTTYCGKCNQSLIERDGGFTAKIMLKDKKCFKCGKPLKGVF
ncbi:MAG: AmmeMemoRadiSam system radical SAM enzyme [Candidatus Woesearchaeota archaeon]